jgi:hypothetical protein
LGMKKPPPFGWTPGSLTPLPLAKFPSSSRMSRAQMPMLHLSFAMASLVP